MFNLGSGGADKRKEFLNTCLVRHFNCQTRSMGVITNLAMRALRVMVEGGLIWQCSALFFFGQKEASRVLKNVSFI